MSVRSRYKEQFLAEKIAEEIPPSEKIDINSEPAADAVVIRHETDALPNVAVAEAMTMSAKADEATARLQRQLEELKRSEELQRQAAAMPHQRPPSREEKLTAWRAQGMNEADEKFLSERGNEALVDHPQITQVAVARALHSGIERGSPEFYNAVKANFDDLAAQSQASPQPAPAFFAPRTSPHPEPSPASFVSAPVSHDGVGSGYREPSPSSVRLTPEEQEIARASGISLTDYARNKLRMLREQASGERQR
jgi:hypothetical protein